MTDTDLIVPIELHALVANENVRKQEGYFTRWVPSFSLMVDPTEKQSGEPRPYQSQEDVHENDLFEGVHLQWELPEALTTGYFHPETGDSVFPLVPNRWLVVRYSYIGTTRRTAGWVVHSDCLASDGLGVSTANPYLNPHADKATYDRIGHAHALSDGPWEEPATNQGLFLTAIGAGLPAFAAFASYHKNVFHFQDTLQDLGTGGTRPATATLSYAVIGWYSDDDKDILRRAADIPGLLPPDAGQRGLRAVLEALGWKPPADMPDTIERSRYSGTALGIEWKHKIGFPISDRPDASDVKVAVGQSFDEAAEALINHQSQEPGTGELVRALLLGNPDALDDADGPIDLNELMRRTWFAGREGGHVWRVVNRVGDDAATPPPPPVQPDWLDTLNEHQAAHDAAEAALADARWQLWSVWWLRHLPADHRPAGYQFDAATWNTKVTELTAAAREREQERDAAREEIPWHEDPDELARLIDEYATKEQLPADQELIRSPLHHYHRPIDPVLVLSGSGTTRPLGRDENDPLPCRLPSKLLTEVTVGATTLLPEPNPLAPNIIGLEWGKPLIAEMAMLEQAARTATGADKTALHDIVATPDALTQGPFPEYTRVWQQPWLPLFLQWEIEYCPTPVSADDWDFYDDGYHWKGSGAPSGDGVGGLRWTIFSGRAFLTPAIPYVLRKQTERLIDSAGTEFVGPLRNLMEDFSKLELLSQNLDGFNDWLLQLDGAAQTTTDSSIVTEAGQSNYVPDGAGDRSQRRFQPVRAGQFYFTDLRIIDRFGQALRIVGPEQQQPIDFEPVRAASVEAEKPLSTPPLPNQKRFIQLPPRLLQDTRLVFEPVRHLDDAPLTTASSTEPDADTPVAGWVLVNHLDQTLLVYAPDGSPLGELRKIRRADGSDELTWTALPHAPFAEPDDFAALYPHVAGFVSGLRAGGLAAFTDLTDTIDNALDAITDPAPEEDRAPARLIGRPVALVRARLGLELLGSPLTDPSWDTILDGTGSNPAAADYTAHLWPIRIGEYQQLADGLIGYFTSELDTDTDYRTLCVTKPVGSSDYLVPIGTGAGLALPARPVGQFVTRYVTLLVCPHTAVHATTDILPVATLKVDADITHRALAAVRASFRLNPLLAPDRPGGTATASTSLAVDPDHPVERMLDGDLSTYFQSTDHANTDHWVMLDLGSPRVITAVHFYQGCGRGPNDRTLHSGEFEYCIDPGDWISLGPLPVRVEEHHIQLADPVLGRYVQIRSTRTDNGVRLAVRRFDVVTDPADGGIVMPKPASWFGDWTWAEPQAGDGLAVSAATPAPDVWTDLAILAADTAAHLGDAIPIARAGYLQLRPAGLEEEGTR